MENLDLGSPIDLWPSSSNGNVGKTRKHENFFTDTASATLEQTTLFYGWLASASLAGHNNRQTDINVRVVNSAWELFFPSHPISSLPLSLFLCLLWLLIFIVGQKTIQTGRDKVVEGCARHTTEASRTFRAVEILWSLLIPLDGAEPLAAFSLLAADGPSHACPP